MKDRKNQHRVRMYTLLKHIYTHPYSKNLGFKGGTALYFFYELPRFSVDIDIDIIGEFDDTSFQKYIDSLYTFVKKQGATIKKDGTSLYSHRYIIQYGGDKKLKLEFTTHSYPNHYEPKDLFGLQIQTMSIQDMFAHKLCAFISRWQQRNFLANRDIFDIHFLLSKNIEPSQDIISIRSEKLTGESMITKQRYTYLIEFIRTHEKHLRANILDGLGELIDETSTKHRIKQKLVDEMLELLQLASMT